MYLTGFKPYADQKIIAIFFVIIVSAQMTNFIVGLTNSTPSLISTVLGSYSICAEYPGYPFGGSVGIIMNCNSSTLAGRYLIIQVPVLAMYLTVCEVEAYRMTPAQLGEF